jgi:hypothetical protein
MSRARATFFPEDVLVAMHQVEGSCTLPLADACHMLETMHDTHVHTALPAIVDTDASLQSLMQRCLECKVGREGAGEGAGCESAAWAEFCPLHLPASPTLLFCCLENETNQAQLCGKRWHICGSTDKEAGALIIIIYDAHLPSCAAPLPCAAERNDA